MKLLFSSPLGGHARVILSEAITNAAKAWKLRGAAGCKTQRDRLSHTLFPSGVWNLLKMCQI